jgi:hypothetical protein
MHTPTPIDIGLLADRMCGPNLWFHLRTGILERQYRTSRESQLEMQYGLSTRRATVR